MVQRKMLLILPRFLRTDSQKSGEKNNLVVSRKVGKNRKLIAFRELITMKGKKKKIKVLSLNLSKSFLSFVSFAIK